MKKRKSWDFSSILTVSLIIIAVGAGIWFVSYNAEKTRTVSFNEAMARMEFGKKYTEQIVKKIGKPNYVIEVVYGDTPEKLEYLKKDYMFIPTPKDMMATVWPPTFSFAELGKKNVLVKIFVFPFAFSNEVIKNERDFISSLKHEYRHAEFFQLGKVAEISIFPSFFGPGGELNKPLFKSVLEVDAIRLEIRYSLGLSQYYQDHRFSKYLEYYTDIWDNEKDINPELIQKIKVEFFELWMLSRPELKREIVSGKKIWWLEHSTTKKKYYLPDEIIQQYGRN